VDYRSVGRIAFLIVILGAVAAAWFSPLGDWFTAERLKASRDSLVTLIEARPVLYTGGFFLLCVAASALCFPAAPIIGIASGALFGFWTGLAAVSLGFVIGSTLAFLGSRHLLRDWVKARLGNRLAAFDRGFERHGPAYLLALRFNPLIPYWLVNLAMGVTRMRPRTYVPLTFIGLLPALFIYVNAGSHLAAIESSSDIVSPELLVSLLLLSLLPLLADRLRTASRQGASDGQG
jgi:uncharacterized membrane protein YdjX (TVP38/TMEM64 family)